MKKIDFEIMSGFIWQQMDSFQEHMRTLKTGQEEGLKQFAAILDLPNFLENNYEAFQEYLENWHEIEGTEAERFIDKLRRQE